MKEQFEWQKEIKVFDERRTLIIPGNREKTILFCVRQFLDLGKEAISERGIYTVALSGGQTPHAIFQELAKPIYKDELDWTKVVCFWSDERNAPQIARIVIILTACKPALESSPFLKRISIECMLKVILKKTPILMKSLFEKMYPNAALI